MRRKFNSFVESLSLYPVQAITMGLAFSVLLFGLAAWSVWSSYSTFTSIAATEFTLQR